MIRTNRFAMMALTAALFMTAHEAHASTGGTSHKKSDEQIAAEKAEHEAGEKAKAKAEKERVAAEKKAAKDKAAAEKAEAKAKADAEKKAAADQAKLDKEAEKAKAAEEKRAAAEQKAKDREAKAAEKTKTPLVSQRGVTQPREGSKTRQVWDIATKLSQEKGSPVAIAELMPVAKEAGLNDATVRTQYARWKDFHGVFGKVAATPAPANDTPAVGTEQAAA